MSNSWVFHGRRYRVKITVYDFEPDSVFRKDHALFAVAVLAQDKHPNTAFSRGRLLYQGPDAAAARRLLCEWSEMPQPPLPARLCHFLNGGREEGSDPLMLRADNHGTERLLG